MAEVKPVAGYKLCSFDQPAKADAWAVAFLGILAEREGFVYVEPSLQDLWGTRFQNPGRWGILCSMKFFHRVSTAGLQPTGIFRDGLPTRELCRLTATLHS